MRNLLLRSLLAVVVLASVPSLLIFAAQNPLQAARDALRKAQEEARAKQQQTKPATPAAAPTPAKPATAAAGAAPAAAEPWTPPVDNSNAKAVVLDPLKMPDVVGVHLGMTAQEAFEALRKQYPKDLNQKFPDTSWPSVEKPNIGYTFLSSEPGNLQDANLSLTAPPTPQVVWRMTRFTYRMHINHTTLLAALREKYGKETVAYQPNIYDRPATDDRQIADLYWLFDETGSRVPLPKLPVTDQASGGVGTCTGFGTGRLNPAPLMPRGDITDIPRQFPGWCENFVGVHVYISSEEIVENTFTEMIDVPLAARTSRAADEWLRNLAEKLRKEELEKTKNVKPAL